VPEFLVTTVVSSSHNLGILDPGLAAEGHLAPRPTGLQVS
jgi:hypothetical protein